MEDIFYLLVKIVPFACSLLCRFVLRIGWLYLSAIGFIKFHFTENFVLNVSASEKVEFCVPFHPYKAISII